METRNATCQTRVELDFLDFSRFLFFTDSLLEMASQQQQTVNITDLDLPALQQVKTQLEEVHCVELANESTEPSCWPVASLYYIRNSLIWPNLMENYVELKLVSLIVLIVSSLWRVKKQMVRFYLDHVIVFIANTYLVDKTILVPLTSSISFLLSYFTHWSYYIVSP